MAIMPTIKQSFYAIKGITERHIRLCRIAQGTEQLISDITGSLETFAEKHDAYEAQCSVKCASTDDIWLTFLNLDDAIRTAFEHCRQYEREFSGEKVLKGIFPKEKYSHICIANREKKLGLVQKTVVRFEELGEEHPLYGEAALLQNKINACLSVQNAKITTVQEKQASRAEEEMAKEKHIHQYRANYFSAILQFGRTIAERLFPRTDRQLAIYLGEDDEISAPLAVAETEAETVHHGINV